MTHFDIKEAIQQRWNDQPSKGEWLSRGCDWSLVLEHLIRDRQPSNPPEGAYVEQVVTDHIKRFGASVLTPYTTIMRSLAYANVTSEATLSGHVRDVYSASLALCRDSYIQAVIQCTVNGMVTDFFEEWNDWEGYP